MFALRMMCCINFCVHWPAESCTLIDADNGETAYVEKVCLALLLCYSVYYSVTTSILILLLIDIIIIIMSMSMSSSVT